MRARKGHTETQEQELAASLQLNLKQTTPMLGGWGEVGRTQRESEIVLQRTLVSVPPSADSLISREITGMIRNSVVVTWVALLSF